MKCLFVCLSFFFFLLFQIAVNGVGINIDGVENSFEIMIDLSSYLYMMLYKKNYSN